MATIGPTDSQQHLRTALALGANRALHVVTDEPLEPPFVARALLKLVEREQPLLAELFLSHLLHRNSRVEEDLIDQLFNSSDKRLARLYGLPEQKTLRIADGFRRVNLEGNGQRGGLGSAHGGFAAIAGEDARGGICDMGLCYNPNRPFG